MRATIFFLLSSMVLNYEKEVFIYNHLETSLEWRIINDGVMGGLSKSSIKLNEDGSSKFTGTLLPDNNGGFASIRAYVEEKDLKEYEGVIANVAGFGAFVDLGLKEKGLIHISNLSDSYISDINSFIKTGQRVMVSILSLDVDKKRISLKLISKL